MMKREKVSSVHIWGVALVIGAIVLGNLVSLLLYQWETRSRALAFAQGPAELKASAPTETAAAGPAAPTTLPQAQPEAKAPATQPNAPIPAAKDRTAEPNSTTPEAKASTTEAKTEAPMVAAPVSFKKDIFPIFQKSCNMCHGTLGGLNLADYSALLNTGDHKPQLIPGKPEASLLVKRLVEKPLMPPQGPLPMAEIEKIRQWIQEGAANN